MNIFEITIGKLIPSLGMFSVLVVNTEIPFRILIKAVEMNELVLLLCRRLMLAPGISLIKDVLSFLDESFRMVECSVVEYYRHDSRSLLSAFLIKTCPGP